MGIFVNFTAAVSYNFYDPILAPSLILDYDIDPNTVGLVFMLITVSYAIGCIIMGKLGDQFDRRAVIGFSMFSSGFCVFLSGGLAIYSLNATIIGLFGFGFFYAGLICSGYAEVMSVMEEQVHRPMGPCPQSTRSHKSNRSITSDETVAERIDLKIDLPPKVSNVTDKSSALMGLGFASGATLGPILAGFLYDLSGFNFSTNILSVLLLAFSFVYISTVYGPERKKNTVKQIELKQEYQGFEDEILSA